MLLQFVCGGAGPLLYPPSSTFDMVCTDDPFVSLVQDSKVFFQYVIHALLTSSSFYLFISFSVFLGNAWHAAFALSDEHWAASSF